MREFVDSTRFKQVQFLFGVVWECFTVRARATEMPVLFLGQLRLWPDPVNRYPA